ncbi:MAG TPA: type IV pilus assembly protein PilM [Actinomycetota bacterium]|nr:type IV pilus assembly protein PilM [Actinomycetota bacterium]
MARTRIGLDVGSTAVRVAEVSMGDVPVVVRAAQVPLPPGAVEAGEIRQPELVTDALRELWSSSGVKGKQVYLGVGNQRVVVREVALPWLPERELRDSLAFQVQEFIPMAADEAVLDYDPLGEMDQGGRRMQRILLVAAHKAMVNALVQAVLAAKLEPLGIDLTPFAVVRAVGAGDEGLDLESPGDEAVIDIGAHVTSICVHDRGVTRFVRILPSGGRDITLAIARGLAVDDGVAEALKRGEPVEPPFDQEGRPMPLPSAEDVRRLALSRAGSFVDEVRSSLEFYAAQVPGARIARVVVTGGGSRLDGFLQLLQERIPVVVDRGRLFERVKSELNLTAEAQAEAEAVLSVAVGLAIAERRRP